MKQDEEQMLKTANWENAGQEVADRARALLIEIDCDYGLQYEQWVAGALLAAREKGRENAEKTLGWLRADHARRADTITSLTTLLEHERAKLARLLVAARQLLDDDFWQGHPKIPSEKYRGLEAVVEEVYQ